jgi:hypothetical protein
MVVSSAYPKTDAGWTGSRADALRRAFGMTNESFAERLGISVRTVAYWRKRPGMVPQQQTKDILDTALERAGDQVREKFARLVANEAGQAPGPVPAPGAFPSVADGDSLPTGDIALLGVFASADMDNRAEVAQAQWLPGAAPGVITSYLFSSPGWPEQAPLVIARAARRRASARLPVDRDARHFSARHRSQALAVISVTDCGEEASRRPELANALARLCDADHIICASIQGASGTSSART